MRGLKMQLSEPAREELYRSVLNASRLDLEYVAMLALAGLIALFGLLQNSVAVIIGAMLISPLMNPILAGSLALLRGDWSLGRRAVSVLAWSILGVIALTWLVAWLTPLNQVTPEILARTNPNLLDMLIAVMAGLAGTLALRGGPVSMTIIPGVAIAVAVIPPLAVVGFSLSTRHGAMAWGGFLLFVTNLVSIMISAAVVFRLMGFGTHGDSEEGRASLRTRMAVSALVLVVLAVPLVQTLRRAVTQIGLRANVEEVVNRGFKTEHSTVNDLSYTQAGSLFAVNVTVRTTQYFGAEHIDAVQQALRQRFGPTAQLRVDQILVAQGGLSSAQISRLKDFISGGMVQPAAKEESFDLKAIQEEVTSYLQKQVDEALLGTSIQSKGSIQALLGTGSPVGVYLHVAAAQPLDQQVVKLLASQLSARIGLPVELHGVVELGSPDYSLALESPGFRRALASRDRDRLQELAESLRKRPDLGLRAELSANGPGVEAVKNSQAWLEVAEILQKSRVPPSQWSMEATPLRGASAVESPPSDGRSAPTNTKSPEPPQAPGPVLCRFRVYQNF